MKRVCVVLLSIIVVLLTLNSYAEQDTSGVFSITPEKSSIALKNGKTETVTLHVEAPDGVHYTIIKENENKNICTLSLHTKDGSEPYLSITGIASGTCTVTVSIKGHPETAKDIIVKVYMSEEEKEMSSKVKYISDYSFFYYDDEDVFILNFAFKDKNEQRIAAPAKIDIKIVNDDGNVVYQKTRYVTPQEFMTWTNSLYGDRLLGSVYIPPEDISAGGSSGGSIYFEASTGNYFFDQIMLSASELPKVDLVKECSLELPDLPCELEESFSETVYSKVVIDQISYEFKENFDGKMTLKLSFTGKKMFDYKGNQNSSSCRIGWKLYDEEGYVIDSGTCITSSLEVGEKFKNTEESIYNLAPGTYSLKLIDAN